MAKRNSLKELQKDVLKEIGTIGAGHAATALSQFVDRKILITVPEANLVPLKKLTEVMGGAEIPVVAVFNKVLGEIPGGILFLVPSKSGLKMVDLLEGKNFGTTKIIGELERELLRQVGNILAASYLNALAKFINIVLIPSVPSFAMDMAGAIFSSSLAELGFQAEKALIVETEIIEKASRIKAVIFFIAEPKSWEMIFKKIGVN